IHCAGGPAIQFERPVVSARIRYHHHSAAVSDSSADDVLVGQTHRTTLGQIAGTFVRRRAKADLFTLGSNEARACDCRSTRVSDESRYEARARQLGVCKLLV